jgi:hypothetical protein
LRQINAAGGESGLAAAGGAPRAGDNGQAAAPSARVAAALLRLFLGEQLLDLPPLRFDRCFGT